MKTSSIISLIVAVMVAFTGNAVPAKKIKNFDKAYKAFENQQWDEATRLFNAAISENDRNAYALAYLGSIKLTQEQPQEAADLLNQAVSLMDESTDGTFRAWAHNEYSAALLEAGDSKAALGQLDKAVQLAPANAHYVLERAVIKYMLKDINGALIDSEKALTLDPDEEDAERAKALNEACATRLSGKAAVAQEGDEFGHDLEERDIVAGDNAVLPKFAGGNDAMKIFIKKNLKYPKSAIKKGIEGTVKVECRIDENGKLVEAEVLEGIDPECDKEALRLCLHMPIFTPGTLDGKPLKSTLLIPVKFDLKNLKNNK
ncbi:MAG: TonB family protein [Bacteroidales bacterium]|uniref:TonB family protein n=1 Tax=Sodaliphilus sp. TaxID=2815818 RepID=UPI001B517068|nr:TonB family protein [Candidatus Sodaliphilus limicaballi]